MTTPPAKRPGWATALSVFCAGTVVFLVVRDLFVPAARDTEVWLGIELHGRLARLTAPLHWSIFAVGAWGFWRLRPWIWPWASVYAFQIALGHLIWNVTGPSGDGWTAGLWQLALFSLPAIVLLGLRPDVPARRSGEIVASSRLAASPETLWRHAVSPSGINRELRPLLRMTFPVDATDIVSAARSGDRPLRSWLLLGGLVPVEYDDLVLVEVEPGRRFLERSSLWTQREWEHERTLEPVPDGCRLTDRVRFVPRLPGLVGLYRPLFQAVFRWRHHNLRRLFGAAP